MGFEKNHVTSFLSSIIFRITVSRGFQITTNINQYITKFQSILFLSFASSCFTIVYALEYKHRKICLKGCVSERTWKSSCLEKQHRKNRVEQRHFLFPTLFLQATNQLLFQLSLVKLFEHIFECIFFFQIFWRIQPYIDKITIFFLCETILISIFACFISKPQEEVLQFINEV